jgi:adenine/guanine/hypoxanthine permease
VIGGLMITSVQNISLQDFSEGFPAFLIIVMIPLTYSIVDGIAFGFIAYPLMKIALGKGREVPLPLYIIAGLFFINFFLHNL